MPDLGAAERGGTASAARLDQAQQRPRQRSDECSTCGGQWQQRHGPHTPHEQQQLRQDSSSSSSCSSGGASTSSTTTSSEPRQACGQQRRHGRTGALARSGAAAGPRPLHVAALALLSALALVLVGPPGGGPLALAAQAKTLHASLGEQAGGGRTQHQRHPRPAAAFTPYFITPGGGEKYLLSTVRAMQTLGFFVDILVQPDNVCQAQQCVMDVATSLRVTLDPELFSVHVVHREGFRIFAGPYDLFFALGNEKYPPVQGVGRVNLFMCQFPFDLDRQVPQEADDVLGSYDAVMLNSHYSLRWYHTYSVPVYHSLHANNRLFPRMQIVHPPVTLLPPLPDAAHRPARKNIVMVGRFFAGRQSKGHPEAVRIFAELYTSLPKDTNLVMVGNPMPGQTSYLDDLNNLVRSFGLTDRIEIVLAAPSERVISILQSGVVQWHLTGLGVQDDPASLEHFGISIVEGMSTGTVPVAYIGGAQDIIQHGHDGYVASSAERVLQFTKQVFGMTAREQQVMQERCIRKSKQFEYARFEETFHNLVTVTQRLKPDPPMAPAVVAMIRK